MNYAQAGNSYCEYRVAVGLIIRWVTWLTGIQMHSLSSRLSINVGVDVDVEYHVQVPVFDRPRIDAA